MTTERIMQIINLADECNSKLYVGITYSHSKWSDDIHISMFYTASKDRPSEYRVFSTFYIGPEDEVKNDTNLEKAEAFMRMLLATAEHCEEMRREV